MGVATVALAYDLTRRRFGRIAGFTAGLALALMPITVAIARHNNPDALLVLCCTVALWAVVRGLEDGRTRWLVLARRGHRPRLRGEDGGRAAGRARARRGVAVGRAPRARRGRAPAARRRRRDDGGRPRVADADVAHAGGRPAVDLGHERQQHLVADPRLQRPRAPVRPGRRSWRGRGSGRRGRRRVRRRPGPAAVAEREPGRPGRLAARLRAGRRPRPARHHKTPAHRSAHGLADRRRRRIPDDRRRLQPRRGDLPPVLRVAARALHRRARRRDRRPDAPARARGPCHRRRGDRRRRRHRGTGAAGQPGPAHVARAGAGRGLRRRGRAARGRARPPRPRGDRRRGDRASPVRARRVVAADARPRHERDVPRGRSGDHRVRRRPDGRARRRRRDLPREAAAGTRSAATASRCPRRSPTRKTTAAGRSRSPASPAPPGS